MLPSEEPVKPICAMVTFGCVFLRKVNAPVQPAPLKKVASAPGVLSKPESSNDSVAFRNRRMYPSFGLIASVPQREPRTVIEIGPLFTPAEMPWPECSVFHTSIRHFSLAASSCQSISLNVHELS